MLYEANQTENEQNIKQVLLVSCYSKSYEISCKQVDGEIDYIEQSEVIQLSSKLCIVLSAWSKPLLPAVIGGAF
jgi:hypothetical protein